MPAAASSFEQIFITRSPIRPRAISLAVKDIFDTAGIRTTYGSAIFADHVPDRTAEAVRRLEAAGYVDVGKANLHEFAFGMTSENPHYGTVPNPLRPGRIAGGSSGGSAAALAAGLADAALGSDTAGSIRAPAACCGVVGFKPTLRAWCPVEGCFPLAPSFDHVGPMARSVGDCAPMMAALAPEMDPVPEIAPGDVEVGVAWTAEAEPLVRARVEEAAAIFPRRRETPSAGDAAGRRRRANARDRRDATPSCSPSTGSYTERTWRQARALPEGDGCRVRGRAANP